MKADQERRDTAVNGITHVGGQDSEVVAARQSNKFVEKRIKSLRMLFRLVRNGTPTYPL